MAVEGGAGPDGYRQAAVDGRLSQMPEAEARQGMTGSQHPTDADFHFWVPWGPDLHTGSGPQPSTFNLVWQPPLSKKSQVQRS